MSRPPFHHKHRVTYSECTIGNHVYYARYLDLLEEARGEFFRYLGTTFQQWQDQDTIFPVLECQLHYKAPARYDEVLTIEVEITHAAGVRLNFHYRITNPSGVLLLEGDTLHVCAKITGRPKAVPAALLQAAEPARPV
jgi:acyl-CoA thioester hydrolase